MQMLQSVKSNHWNNQILYLEFAQEVGIYISIYFEYIHKIYTICRLFVLVLSFAELAGISAKLYILYIDNFVLDSKCAEPLLKILTDETNCKLEHLKFTENFFSKGNLYM